MSTAELPPVTVCYRFALDGARGETEPVPCDRDAVDAALSRQGGGGWAWRLDAVSPEQARALEAYSAEGLDVSERMILLPSGRYVLVEVT